MRWLMCFLPPLAILSCGKPVQFLISIILTCLGYIPGVIHAFLVVGQYQADQRNHKLVEAIKNSRTHD